VDTLNLIAVWTVHAVAILSTIFVILYLRSQWNRNAGGRSLMLLAVGFAAFVDETIVRYWIPLHDYPYRRILDCGIYLLVLASWIYLVITLVRAQRDARRDRDRH